MSREPLPEHLDVGISVRDGRYTVALEGELDVVSAAQLEAILLQISSDAATGIRLDLSALTFMDSTGLRTVLLAKELSDSNGWALSLVPGPPKVQRLFELTALLDVLPFEDDADDISDDGRATASEREP